MVVARSAMAVQAAQDAGLASARHIQRGIDAWKKGGGTLPGLSLAMKAHAGYVIASALLRTFLGEQLGRRVQAGAIERGLG
jgi:hypothetical protein